MDEIELSLMNYVGYQPEVAIRPLLDQFESLHHCRVKVRTISWDTGRRELVEIALHGKGPHVSEIGTTWCPGFISMQALRPFAPDEIESFGGSTAFFPSSWQTARLSGVDQRMWAIPWLAAVHSTYYRRDLLEQAGIDEKQAFLSPSHLLQTLQRLQACGVPIPFAIATRNLLPPSLHNLASFVWAAGGDFVARDGTRTLFHLPETRTGVRTFLELGRYLSAEVLHLDQIQSEALFWQERAAVTFGWEQPLKVILEKFATPCVMANLGTALIPGVSFVGGSNLVIWRHVAFSHERLALELVRFLTSQQAQRTYNPRIGLLPVRPDVLQDVPFTTDPSYPVLLQGLKTGRSFPVIPQWGIVEDRLMTALSQLWETVLARPEQNLDAVIVEQLEPIGERLDLMLRPA